MFTTHNGRQGYYSNSPGNERVIPRKETRIGLCCEPGGYEFEALVPCLGPANKSSARVAAPALAKYANT